jgi:hypothetical protein
VAVLVVHAGATDRGDLARARAILDELGTRLLGSILVEAPRRRGL